MATYLLKKSYQLKNLEEVDFSDLWGGHGVFTTMWIFDKPYKILFFNNHLNNLIKSSKAFGIYKSNLKQTILAVLKKNLLKKKKYNHLLRIAINKKLISISLRKKIMIKKNFNLKLVKLKRQKPKYKNLKYKKILFHLSKLDNAKTDIGLVNKNKLLETGTSNLLFVKSGRLYSPINNFYKGITIKFLEKKLSKIYKKNIFIDKLNQYDEILLLGSGKGVTSVKDIHEKNWKRKSFKFFNLISKKFNSEVQKSFKLKL